MNDQTPLHGPMLRRGGRGVLLVVGALASLAVAAPQRRGEEEAPGTVAGANGGGLHVLMDEGQRRVSRALDGPVTVYFSGGLREFARVVEAAAGVRVALDEKALGAEVVDASSVVVGVQGVSLRAALGSALAQVDGAYAVRDGVLLLTSRDKVDEYLLTRAYYVGDLVLRRPPARAARWWRSSTQPFLPRMAGTRHLSNRELDSWIALVDVVRETIDPDSWGDVGGPGTVEPFPSRGAIVVTHSEAVHTLVAELIAKLRSVPVDERALSASALDRGISLSPSGEAEEAIRRALERPATLRLGRSTLAQVAAAIETQYGIEVALDRSIIDDIGAETRVRIDHSGIKLRSVLRLVLSQVDATYAIRNEALCLCTETAAEDHMAIRLYPVRDLVLRPGEPAHAADYDSLMDVIREAIEPDTWDDVGGPGSMEPFPQRPCLVIGQTEPVHERVAWLLGALRAIPMPGLPPRAPEGEPGLRDSSEREAAIRRALDEPAVVQWNKWSLSELINRLERRYGIAFALDRSIVEELGPDVPVSSSVEGISLGAALKLLLEPIDATYQIRNETVCLMTKDAAEDDMISVIYPVADLVHAAGAASAARAFDDYDSLTELIVETIEPDSWDDVGGPGSIGVFPHRPSLIVTQTDAVHERIGALLTQLRRLPTVEAGAQPLLFP